MNWRPEPLTADRLRWHCDPQALEFETTADVEPVHTVVGQPLAVEALEFGLDCDAPGQNVYVRGSRGTGRMTLVRDMLDDMKPRCRSSLDRCYVHNFLQPDRPRLISLPRGQGRDLRKQLLTVAEFVAQGLGDAMNSPPLQASRTAISDKVQKSLAALSKPFEDRLAKQQMALVQIKTAHGNQPAIFFLHEGQKIAPEQLDQLVTDGKVTDEVRDKFIEQRDEAARELPQLRTQVARVHREASKELNNLNDKHLRDLLAELIEPIRQDFNHESLEPFLNELVDDIVEHALNDHGTQYDPFARYGVNILLEHQGNDSPVVIESSPNVVNLLGTIENQWTAKGNAHADYRAVRGGSLLAADGGFLILDAHDLLSEPGAWKILMRTLRTGLLEIVPAEYNAPFARASIKPEPIPIAVRVILIGDHRLYYYLDSNDQDFSDQFKVLADFSDTLERDAQGLWQYARVISRMVRSEGLLHFAASGVATLAEHGARIADKEDQLTARFGRIADIARESAWVADRDPGAELVTAEHVRQAIARTKRRASLPSTRFQSHLKDKTIRIETSGEVVGQINGLAVISAGPLKYGFPARITASIGAGSAGIIDVEGRASMSGSIHTKGFQILGGLLRHLLHTDHPLAFSASLAFEQSYGGIDGDSASGAEMCCLLSALTDIPIRQSFAMTGAIDQHGALQAIGGVNEKIEGFFDICEHFGLTGDQGVIVPAANAGDLMLRQNVVDACKAGKFAIYAVDRIESALSILTGVEVGRWDPIERIYTDNSLLAQARQRAEDYWRATNRRPGGGGDGEDDT